MNPSKVISGELRDAFLKDNTLRKNCKYKDVVQEFMVHHQRACYEEFIFKLAESLEGYRFYLPNKRLWP